MPRGGARVGAGRPKGATAIPGEAKAAETVLKAGKKRTKRFKTALDFAMSTINDPEAPLEAKIRLAVAVMPFQHPKLEAVGPGKKEQRERAAKDAAVGKLAPPAPPKLVVDNR